MTEDTSEPNPGRNPDLLVLRRGTHGMPTQQYVEALQERLPDRTIVRARTPDEERQLIEQVPIATGNVIDDGVIEHATGLDAFMCTYAGTDHLPMDALREHGIAVTNASGVHGPNIAEHVCGAILHFTRLFDVATRRAERNEYRHYQVRELQGSTVTVVGLGAIGTTVLTRLDAFEVDTVGVRHTPSKGGPADRVVGFGAIHDAIADADYIVLSCPLTDTTRGLLDQAAFETMHPESVLVNVARGPLVDTDALCWALRRNAIRGAALDVTDPEPLPPDHPLWTFDNVLLTPHNAGHTPAYYERLADIVAENVGRIDRGEELTNRVA
jgi:phosphoglycerate dehydrogenase-like enzyme